MFEAQNDYLCIKNNTIESLFMGELYSIEWKSSIDFARSFNRPINQSNWIPNDSNWNRLFPHAMNKTPFFHLTWCQIRRQHFSFNWIKGTTKRVAWHIICIESNRWRQSQSQSHGNCLITHYLACNSAINLHYLVIITYSTHFVRARAHTSI